MNLLMMRSIFLCGLFLAGCSTPSSDSSFETVRTVIEQRIDEKIVWREEVQEMKRQLLQEVQQQGLTQEVATQLALVNNPDLFAYYETLELGYADLLEAGLFQNPFFSFSIRFPSQSHYRLNNLFDAALSFLDLFLIPLRKKAAEAEIHVIESQIGQRVLDLVKEVQMHWVDLKSLDLHIEQQTRCVELKQLQAALAVSQYRVGNISALGVKERTLFYENAQVQLKSLMAEREQAKEAMNRALGLFGNEVDWTIQGELEWELDTELPALFQMEKAAVENRLDVESVRRETAVLARKAKLKEWWTYSNLVVGVSSEMQPEGFTTTGPSVELQLPIFNYGQAEKKRYHARLEQAQKRLLSKAVDACSQVREFFKTAQVYRAQMVDLEQHILPNVARQLVLGQAHYHVMTLGVYDLLDLKAQQIEMRIEQIHVQQHYKKARIELLYAVGGSFDLVRGQP